MGNLQKETLIFPFLAWKNPKQLVKHQDSPILFLPWIGTVSLRGSMASMLMDGVRADFVNRSAEGWVGSAEGWASFVFESAWNRPGQPAQQKGYLALKWEDSKDM